MGAIASNKYKYKSTNTKTQKYRLIEKYKYNPTTQLMVREELQYKVQNNGSDSVRQIQIQKHTNTDI